MPVEHEMIHGRATWEQMLNQAMELSWPHSDGKMFVKPMEEGEIRSRVKSAAMIADALYEAVENRWPGVPRCTCEENEERDD